MAFESLSNPLERLGVLPTTMNARFIGPSLTWNSAVQYFQNDVVLSGVDGGAYVCEVTSVLGGTDPASTPAAWTKLAPDGIRNTTTVAIPSSSPAAFPGAATITAPAGSSWLVTIQGSLTTAAPTANTDVTTFTITPNGAGAVTAILDAVPVANGASLTTEFGMSAVVTVGTGGTTITPTAATVGAASTLIGRISYTRIS